MAANFLAALVTAAAVGSAGAASGLQHDDRFLGPRGGVTISVGSHGVDARFDHGHRRDPNRVIYLGDRHDWDRRGVYRDYDSRLERRNSLVANEKIEAAKYARSSQRATALLHQAARMPNVDGAIQRKLVRVAGSCLRHEGQKLDVFLALAQNRTLERDGRRALLNFGLASLDHRRDREQLRFAVEKWHDRNGRLDRQSDRRFDRRDDGRPGRGDRGRRGSRRR